MRLSVKDTALYPVVASILFLTLVKTRVGKIKKSTKRFEVEKLVRVVLRGKTVMQQYYYYLLLLLYSRKLNCGHCASSLPFCNKEHGRSWMGDRVSILDYEVITYKNYLLFFNRFIYHATNYAEV